MERPLNRPYSLEVVTQGLRAIFTTRLSLALQAPSFDFAADSLTPAWAKAKVGVFLN